MKVKMKILIAYDGSDRAGSVLDDLRQAGLPPQADAVVLSVYEHWLPVPSSLAEIELGRLSDHSNEDRDPLVMAMRAAAFVKSSFHDWDVRAETAVGSPASVIVQKADEWRPDLIVVGSHRRSALVRFFLGSVSQGVLHSARCSVRVARGPLEEPGRPVRVIVGVDGSKGAKVAINAVAERHWPPGSEVRLVNGTWAVPQFASEQMVVDLEEWIAAEDVRVQEVIAASTLRLQAAGLRVSTLVRKEEPKHMLVSEAEAWGANCIFVGARGMGTFERLLLGSVSSAVAARAHCSVEVVRAH
jgi:nucleotide-binding universal stress UspA family protein